MVETSASWKAAFNNPLLGESYVEVSIDCADRALLATATASTSTGEMPGSDVASIMTVNTIQRCGTLESGVWILDNTVDWRDSNSTIGYVSNAVSDETGEYDTEPVVTITLDSVTDVPGLTITWSSAFNEWAIDFDVEFFDNNNDSILKKSVINNMNVVASILNTVEDCKKIVITVNKWCLPGRRARIENVTAGAVIVFNKREILKFSSEQTVSPINAELPTARLDFSVQNYDGKYSTNSELDVSKYIEKQQRVNVRIGLTVSGNNVEWISGGTFYVDEWGFEYNNRSFYVKARDSLYFMRNKYLQGVYSMQGATLKALAQAVLQDASLQYTCIAGSYLDDGLLNYTSMAYLPKLTHAELLQIIAQAAGMQLGYDRNGYIRIEPISYDDTDSQGTMAVMNFYDHPKYTLNDLPGILNCKVHNYTTTKVVVPANHFPNVAGYNYISVRDAQLVWTATANIGTGQPSGLTPEQEEKADADMDGTITAWDATLLSKFSAMAGAMVYSNDLAGWEIFFNETEGNKKIVAKTDVQQDASESIQLIVNHSPSYEITIHPDSDITSMSSSAEMTTLTIRAGQNMKTISLYGYPISENSYDYPITIIADNDSIQGVDNPLITSTAMASAAMDTVRDWILNTSVMQLSNYRADPAFDTGLSQFGSDYVYITDIRYEYNGAFHGSVTGKVVETTTPPPTPTDTYKFVEYIKSTGTQYVVTDIIPTYSMKVDMTAQFDNLNLSQPAQNQILFGYYASATSAENAPCFAINLNASYYQGDTSQVENGVYYYYGYRWSSDIDQTIHLTKIDSSGQLQLIIQHGVCQFSDLTTDISGISVTRNAPSVGMPIFGGYYNDAGTPGYFPYTVRDLMLYSFKIYDGQTLIHDLRPAERERDSALGLLDVVTDKFYTNAGTGSFAKGGYLPEE